jgi:hypothetical protein
MDRVMGGLETGGRLAGEEMATIPTRAGAGFGFGDSQLAKNAIAQMTTWTAASPGLGLNQLRDLPDQFYDSEHRPREQFRPSMTSPAVEQMWRQFDRSRVNYRGEKGDFSDFPVYHGGGVVGSTPVAHRVLSSSLFKHAPRFAGGLAPDEYPAVLHAGETVTPAAGRMRSSSSPTVVVNTPPQQAPNVTVNVINNTGAQVTTNTQEEHGNIKLDIMLDEIVSAKMRDGGSRISRTMSSMGARPQPVRR